MGQRLNVSIRKNDEILASAYWHWSGYTISSLAIAKDIMTNLESVGLKNGIDYYDYESFSVGILESIGCKIFNDRNDGRMIIGSDQDTSEANIVIDLDRETIDLSAIFWDGDYVDDDYDIVFKVSYLPIIPITEALPIITDLINNKYTVVDFNGYIVRVID